MEEPLGRLKPPLQCPPPGSRTEARLARSTAFLLEKGSSVPRVVWCHGRLGQSPARYCRPGIFSPPVSVPPTRSLSSPPPHLGQRTVPPAQRGTCQSGCYCCSLGTGRFICQSEVNSYLPCFWFSLPGEGRGEERKSELGGGGKQHAVRVL